jgi:hypothetical protein
VLRKVIEREISNPLLKNRKAGTGFLYEKTKHIPSERTLKNKGILTSLQEPRLIAIN